MKNARAYIIFSIVFLSFVIAITLTNKQDNKLEAQSATFESIALNSFKISQDDTYGFPEDSQNVSDFISESMWYQMAVENIPGAVVSIVKDDELYLINEYGMADFETFTLMDSNRSLFLLDGISNVFTATAVMQLVEEEQIDLNTDINIYLSDFKIPNTFSDPITLSHLLTHTAGFEITNIPISNTVLENVFSLEDFLIKGMPERVHAPGEVASYSSYGYALIGYLIEEVTGETFEDYIKQNIFDPMEMNYSSFEYPLPSHLENLLATSYRGNYINTYDHPYYVGPSLGTLYSSAGDMAKFMTMQLNDGEYNGQTILSSSSADKLLTDQFRWYPELPGISYGMISYKIQNLTAIGLLGGSYGYYGVMALVPKENIGIFIAYNSDQASEAPGEMLQNILSEYYPYQYINSTEAEFEYHPNYRSRVGRYTGSYASNIRNYSIYLDDFDLLEITSRDGYILVGIEGMRNLTFVETEPMLFRESTGRYDLRIAFKEDRNGRIAYMYANWFSPAEGYDKIHPWYHRPEAELMLIAIINVLFLISIFAYLYIAIVGFTGGSGALNWIVTATRWFIVPLYLVLQIMIISVNLKMTEKTRIISETGTIFQDLTFIIIATLGMIIGGIILTILVWTGKGNNNKPYWTKGLRIHYTVLIAASFPIIWLLLNWMLII